MRPLAALLVSLALVAGTTRALAAPFASPVPPAGVVPVGALVVTQLPPLPAGAYEFELFLVPDAGAPVRVSSELHAGAREVRWRMPAVAARRARLVLRAGGEHEEWESAPSAPFALAELPVGELSRILGGRSEAGAELESDAGAADAGLSAAPDAPSISPGAALGCAVESIPPLLDAPATQGVARQDDAVRRGRPACPIRGCSNTPGFTPLRN